MTTQQQLQTIKAQKEQKVNQLINDCSMFFAFSNEQFTENKTPLKEGEKYVSLGAGAYMPKGQVDNYLNGIKEINKWYKSEMKASKDLRKANIIYELNNYEAFYTGEIDDVLNALGSDYTRTEVWKVYVSERDHQMCD